MLTEDDPIFANWDQDATALEDRYWAQDPATVSAELAAAGAQIADAFAAVAGDEWQRPGRRSNGSVFTVESLGRYFVHDLVHHVADISRSLGADRLLREQPEFEQDAGEQGRPERDVLCLLDRADARRQRREFGLGDQPRRVGPRAQIGGQAELAQIADRLDGRAQSPRAGVDGCTCQPKSATRSLPSCIWASVTPAPGGSTASWTRPNLRCDDRVGSSRAAMRAAMFATGTSHRSRRARISRSRLHVRLVVAGPAAADRFAGRQQPLAQVVLDRRDGDPGAL